MLKYAGEYGEYCGSDLKHGPARVGPMDGGAFEVSMAVDGGASYVVGSCSGPPAA